MYIIKASIKNQPGKDTVVYWTGSQVTVIKNNARQYMTRKGADAALNSLHQKTNGIVEINGAAYHLNFEVEQLLRKPMRSGII